MTCGVLSVRCETGSNELNSINVTERRTDPRFHEVPRQYVRAVRQAFHDHPFKYGWRAKPSKLSMSLHGQLLCVPTLRNETTPGKSPHIYDYQRSKKRKKKGD
jgi:hypothetical protein